MVVGLRLFILFVFLASSACHAKVRYPSRANGYSVSIEDEHGNPLDTYGYRGKTYVLGQYDHRYQIRISNHTSRRIEAVVSVDGRDAMSGVVGDYVGQRGYIVEGHQSFLVEGFRQSQTQVASFRFTNPSDSYSARMGTPHNIGVVGVAIFPERRHPPASVGAVVPRGPRSKSSEPRPPVTHYSFEDASIDSGGGLRGSGSAGPSRRGRRARPSAPLTQQRLGTRYGESRHSPIQYVRFRRHNPKQPRVVLGIYYDDASGLASRGIQIHRAQPIEPSPFPRQVHYAPPPP